MDISQFDDILCLFALRFDGEEVLARTDWDPQSALRVYNETGTWEHIEASMRHATFYALQRWLYVWGGQQCPFDSIEWRAFRSLFYLNCREYIPRAYRFQPWYDRWESAYAHRIDECVAVVHEFERSVLAQPSPA